MGEGFASIQCYGPSRVESNAISFNAAISACEKGGKWAAGLYLFDEMSYSLVELDTISFNAAISACEKGCKWEKALHLLLINTITFISAICACDRGCF